MPTGQSLLSRLLKREDSHFDKLTTNEKPLNDFNALRSS
jgi:hypothetical protein